MIEELRGVDFHFHIDANGPFFPTGSLRQIGRTMDIESNAVSGRERDQPAPQPDLGRALAAQAVKTVRSALIFLSFAEPQM